jgi:hypothetical protein
MTDHLRQVTAPRRPWFNSLHGKFEFVGTVSANDFRLTPVIKGRNSYLPVLHGRIDVSNAGTEIQIVESLHPIVIFILLSIFILLPLVVAGFSREFLLWVLMLFVFHCVMYFVGFLPAARKAEDCLRRIAA